VKLNACCSKGEREKLQLEVVNGKKNWMFV